MRAAVVASGVRGAAGRAAGPGPSQKSVHVGTLLLEFGLCPPPSRTFPPAYTALGHPVGDSSVTSYASKSLRHHAKSESVNKANGECRGECVVDLFSREI
jgi:hypothetical protein